MKPLYAYPLTAAATCMIGLASVAIRSTIPKSPTVAAPISAEASPTITHEVTPQSNPVSAQDVPCVNLPEDNKYRAELNGTRLKLALDGKEEENISGAKVVSIPKGGLLVMLDNTLYRFNAEKRIVWIYTEAQFMFDFTLIPATGLIYGTAGDGVMFILEASTGKRLVRHEYMGRAAYGVVRPFGKDQCLVTSDYSGYRQDWKELDLPGMKDVRTWRDEITAYRGTKALWSRDFPPDADLVVDGERILAVTKTESSIYVKEVSVPAKRIAR